MLIGVCDREGTPIRIGDTLEFDEREWGGPDNRFVVEWQPGRLLHNGSLSDLTEWCRVVERATAPSPWQLIETMPDGYDDVLVCNAGGDVRCLAPAVIRGGGLRYQYWMRPPAPPSL
jgi:hypothetical protein